MHPDPRGRRGFALITVMLVVIDRGGPRHRRRHHRLGPYPRQPLLRPAEPARRRRPGGAGDRPGPHQRRQDASIPTRLRHAGGRRPGNGRRAATPSPACSGGSTSAPRARPRASTACSAASWPWPGTHGGGVVVRRAQVFQESFAKYAYFTDVEPSNISFGGGDQIFGPVHTNDYLKIYSSGATFHDEATTAKTVQGATLRHVQEGLRGERRAHRHARDRRPDQAPGPGHRRRHGVHRRLARRGRARPTCASSSWPSTWTATASVTGDERGLLPGLPVHRRALGLRRRALERRDARTPSNAATTTAARSCRRRPSHQGRWRPPDAPGSPTTSAALSSVDASAATSAARTPSSAASRPTTPRELGAVARRRDPPLVAGRADAQYLFPLSRALNPSFKGVIYVDGQGRGQRRAAGPGHPGRHQRDHHRRRHHLRQRPRRWGPATTCSACSAATTWWWRTTR